jgi:hypothetical protein
MSDTKINCDSFSGLDDEEKTLTVSCGANKRRKVSSPSLSVPPHVLHASRLLQTLTLCPDSNETTVPINLTKPQWDKICTFLLKVKQEGNKMKHPCSRVQLMCLVRLLPLCSYLNLDEKTMCIIGRLIMRSLLIPVKVLEEQYEELITTIKQHLSISQLMFRVDYGMILQKIHKLDYRVLMMLNRDWKGWIPDSADHHKHIVEVRQGSDVPSSVTLHSSFISMVERLVSLGLHVESCFLKKPIHGDLAMAYCKAFAKEEEVKGHKDNIHNMLEEYRCLESEKESFWEALNELARQKKKYHDVRVSRSKRRCQLKDDLAVFLKKYDLTDNGFSSQLFTNDELDCSIKFYGSVVPPEIHFYGVDFAPLNRIMDNVLEREWTGFRLRDDPIADQFRTPVFRSLKALCAYLERTHFGILDVHVLKTFYDCIYVDIKDQVIPASNELPWEIRVVDRVLEVKVHPDAEYIRPGPIARKFIHVIKRLAK